MEGVLVAWRDESRNKWSHTRVNVMMMVLLNRQIHLWQCLVQSSVDKGTITH